jgi:Xaa-Pro dipeptidase
MGFSGLSEQIYRDRITHVQEILEKRNLDALFVFSDEYRPGYTFYFADYFPVNVIEESPQGVYIPKDGDVVLFLGGINAKVAQDISWIKDIRSVESLTEFFTFEMKRIGRKIRTGLVGEAILPMKYGKRLEPLIESNDFIKSDDIVNSMRMIKSPDEIKLMEEVGKLADISLNAAVSRLGEGTVSETELAAVAEYEIRKVGGVIGSATILAAGINTTKPTWRPSTKLILPGEPVLIDINPLLNGYCADTAITVFCGYVPEEAKEAYKVGKEIHQGVVEIMKPGEPASCIYDYFLRETTKAGFQDEFKKYAKGMRAVGHGVGLDVVEWPNLDKDSRFILEPGMVLGVKFDLHGFSFGGLRNEVEVLVESNGCRSLNQIIYTAL